MPAIPAPRLAAFICVAFAGIAAAAPAAAPTPDPALAASVANPAREPRFVARDPTRSGFPFRANW
jgi:hypothetical protein